MRHRKKNLFVIFSDPKNWIFRRHPAPRPAPTSGPRGRRRGAPVKFSSFGSATGVFWAEKKAMRGPLYLPSRICARICSIAKNIFCDFPAPRSVGPTGRARPPRSQKEAHPIFLLLYQMSWGPHFGSLPGLAFLLVLSASFPPFGGAAEGAGREL